jgi:hypothetical protein
VGTAQKETNANRQWNNNKSVVALDEVLPKGAVKKGAYVPPHLRGKNNVPGYSPKGGGGGTATGGGGATAKVSDESDTEKRVKTLKKKLDDIVKLKERVKAGQRLELNQVEKIKSEEKLRQEYEQLQQTSP